MYPVDITPEPDRNAAKLLLTEIGVWEPSESLPSHSDAGVIAKRIYQEQSMIETLNDANADVRYDFGDMPVYTIDDEFAHELDDGISIEETDEGTWLHIHIAIRLGSLAESLPLLGLRLCHQIARHVGLCYSRRGQAGCLS